MNMLRAEAWGRKEFLTQSREVRGDNYDGRLSGNYDGR
jgi:hypothetical protein